MHELAHLDFVIEARTNNNNCIYYSTNQNKEAFLKDIEQFIQKLNKKGFSDETIVDVSNQMFNGMNIQLFNTPIDLFIEDYLFDKFPELRPIQFISLYEMYSEYVEGLKHPDRVEYSPFIVSKANSVLILVMLYQFNEIFGLNFIPSLKIEYGQKILAKELYSDWLKHRHNRSSGFEYNLVKEWGLKLKLNNYFELKKEDTQSNLNLIDKLKVISGDPFNLNDPEAQKQEGKTLDYSDSPAGSMAVTMYCLDALQTFDSKPSDFIRDVGFEIATLGRFGLDPNNNEKKYHLNTLPDKTFSALHLLSFMYVAFQYIDKTLNTDLKFENEYNMAKMMFNK